nr:MAG TPA: hypothetical protein [Caudoviricetes sp.]
MLTTFNILAVSQVACTINFNMAKYSELGNVKFMLRIVAQFLCGCGRWLWPE